MNPAIETRDLGKRYGDQPALAGVSLEVPAGRTTILLGPNGAGKTTLIELIMGLRRPSSGAVTVLGYDSLDPESQPWRREVGYVPQDVQPIPYLSGGEYVRLMAELYGIDPARVEERVPAALEFFDMTASAGKRMSGYSPGMRKRVLLAAIQLSRPKLLVLDEPFEGLDPHIIRGVQGWLKEVTAQGTTVLLSSHILPLVEKVGDRVAVLHRGALRHQGPMPGTDEARGAAHETLEALYFSLIPDPRSGNELDR